MKYYNLNDLLNNIDFESNRLVKINNKLYLTNYQIEILNKYNIDYKSLGNLSSIIYVAEEILEEDDYEDKEEYIQTINSLPTELEVEITVDKDLAKYHLDEEDLIADEITLKTNRLVKNFKYTILEEK